MAKSTVKKDIKKAKEAFLGVMRENLAGISQSMIEQVMKNYRNLSPAQRIKAIKDITPIGIASYRMTMLSSAASVVSTALEKARKEVPKKSKVELSGWDEAAIRLGEFEKLPAKVRKRLKTQIDLLVNTQKADLDKVIMFQFTSSLDSTDSEETIQYDLFEAAEDYVFGNSVDAGAGIMAARGINEARQAFFFDDQVLEEIDAFIFMNEVPNSPICEDLSNEGKGKVFAKDDPGLMRYTPPLHYNCDSYILPILKGNLGDQEVELLRPSSPDLEKYIQFHENCCTGRVQLAELS